MPAFTITTPNVRSAATTTSPKSTAGDIIMGGASGLIQRQAARRGEIHF